MFFKGFYYGPDILAVRKIYPVRLTIRLTADTPRIIWGGRRYIDCLPIVYSPVLSPLHKSRD